MLLSRISANTKFFLINLLVKKSCSGDFQESTSSFLEDSEVYQHGEEF